MIKADKNFFRLIGFIFIIVYGIILLRKIPAYGVSSAIWYCDWVMLFAGIALLLNSEKLLSPLLIQSVMVQSPWLIDAFFLSAFGVQTMNLTNYLFNDWPLVDFILALRHFIVIPILLIFFFQHDFFKGKRFHFLVSIISYAFVMSLTLFLTRPETNTNCSFEPCISFFPFFDSLWGYHLFFVILLGSAYCVFFYLIPKLITKMKTNSKVSILTILSVFTLLAIITMGRYILSF